MWTTKQFGINRFIGMPIILNNGDMFGTLCAFDKTHHTFSEKHAALLKETADAIAYLIDLEQATMFDALTGVFNRTYIEKNFTFWKDIIGMPSCAMLFIDINNFKKVNDTYGHPTGDHILQVIASRLSESAPKSSIVARIGGDEFMVLLPDGEIVNLLSICERMITSIDEPIQTMDETYLVKVSMGVSLYPEEGQDVSTLMKKADMAMYAHKKDGKPFIPFHYREKQEDQLTSQNHERSWQASDHVPASFSLDLEGRFLSVNNIWSLLTGYSSSDILQRSFLSLVDPESVEHISAILQQSLQGEKQTYVATLLHKDGHHLDVKLHQRPITLENQLVGVSGMTQEDSNHSEEEMIYINHHDQLTQLPNRYYLTKRLEDGLDAAKQNKTKMALVCMGLERFEMINDSYGYQYGDQVLQEVTKRLQVYMKENIFVSRMGNEDFAFILQDIVQHKEIDRFAQGLLDLFKEPFLLEGEMLSITPSVGIALYPQDTLTTEGLIKRALTATHYAESERNTYTYYTSEMSNMNHDLMSMESELAKAIDQHEFQLLYQPIIKTNTGEIIGVEALIRWHHPEKGLISPDVFIPLAEETGLIVPIGEWVLRSACKQNVEWQQKGHTPMRISVNLSSVQLIVDDIVGIVQKILNETRMEAAYLELEVTEKMTVDNVVMHQNLEKLKNLGIQLSVDDFGTGYSSLSYLHALPLDVLKIDKSFIHDSNQTALVEMIITIAHHLKLSVTAEGIETTEQLAFIKASGCENAQGYYFSRPVTADVMEGYLKDNPWGYKRSGTDVGNVASHVVNL